MAFDAKYHRKRKGSPGQYVKAYQDGGKVDEYDTYRDLGDGAKTLRRKGYEAREMEREMQNEKKTMEQRSTLARAAGSMRFHDYADELAAKYPRAADPKRKVSGN